MDSDLLVQLLLGVSADARNPDEYFDEIKGELKLPHMSQTKVFTGIQKDVIKMFWKERHSASLKWADVVALTDCGKDPGSVFGGMWKQWLERVEYGRYRLRTTRTT